VVRRGAKKDRPKAYFVGDGEDIVKAIDLDTPKEIVILKETPKVGVDLNFEALVKGLNCRLSVLPVIKVLQCRETN